MSEHVVCQTCHQRIRRTLVRCVGCNKGFLRMASRDRAGHRIWCGPDCPARSVVRPCATCGRSVRRTPSVATRAKNGRFYCGWHCYARRKSA